MPSAAFRILYRTILPSRQTCLISVNTLCSRELAIALDTMFGAADAWGSFLKQHLCLSEFAKILPRLNL